MSKPQSSRFVILRKKTNKNDRLQKVKTGKSLTYSEKALIIYQNRHITMTMILHHELMTKTSGYFASSPIL